MIALKCSTLLDARATVGLNLLESGLNRRTVFEGAKVKKLLDPLWIRVPDGQSLTEPCKGAAPLPQLRSGPKPSAVPRSACHCMSSSGWGSRGRRICGCFSRSVAGFLHHRPTHCSWHGSMADSLSSSPNACHTSRQSLSDTCQQSPRTRTGSLQVADQSAAFSLHACQHVLSQCTLREEWRCGREESLLGSLGETSLASCSDPEGQQQLVDQLVALRQVRGVHGSGGDG